MVRTKWRSFPIQPSTQLSTQKLAIESEFDIFKIENCVFSIGSFDFNDKIVSSICKILSLGSKFIPNYFHTSEELINFLVLYFDKGLAHFNSRLFFKNLRKNSETNKKTTMMKPGKEKATDKFKELFDKFRNYDRQDLNYRLQPGIREFR